MLCLDAWTIPYLLLEIRMSFEHLVHAFKLVIEGRVSCLAGMHVTIRYAAVCVPECTMMKQIGGETTAVSEPSHEVLSHAALSYLDSVTQPMSRSHRQRAQG